jgi:glycosyltransferase involved in cell wall biosynthesis
MDIYLLSSFSEGTSMTLLEAMSLSKPCVVTDVGGNPEVISDGVNGFVTPNNDKTSFANGITKALIGLKQNNQLGEVSLIRFNQLFSEKQMNTFYKELYDRVV